MAEQSVVEPVSWQQWKSRHGRWAELLCVEWASEWISYWSRDWEFVKALELVGKFTIVVAAITWFLEAGQREQARQEATKSKHYRAWQIINMARDSPGDAGRRYAILDLYADKISLSGAPLSNINLDDIELSKVILTKSLLRNASLERACLKEARLSKADLSGSNLAFAILKSADLTGSTIVDADLTSSNMELVILNRSNISNSNLSKANLRGAFITKTIFTGVNLKEADLTGAEIDNITDLKAAKLCRTKMPNGQLDSSSCPNEASEAVPEMSDIGTTCKD